MYIINVKSTARSRAYNLTIIAMRMPMTIPCGAILIRWVCPVHLFSNKYLCNDLRSISWTNEIWPLVNYIPVSRASSLSKFTTILDWGPFKNKTVNQLYETHVQVKLATI